MGSIINTLSQQHRKMDNRTKIKNFFDTIIQIYDHVAKLRCLVVELYSQAVEFYHHFGFDRYFEAFLIWTQVWWEYLKFEFWNFINFIFFYSFFLFLQTKQLKITIDFQAAQSGNNTQTESFDVSDIEHDYKASCWRM